MSHAPVRRRRRIVFISPGELFVAAEVVPEAVERRYLARIRRGQPESGKGRTRIGAAVAILPLVKRPLLLFRDAAEQLIVHAVKALPIEGTLG